MRDAVRLAASISTAAILCLTATAAPQADTRESRQSREIIETEFASPPASRTGGGHTASDAYLPAVEPPLQLVPVEVIGALSPLDSYRGPLGSSDGSAARPGGTGPAGVGPAGNGPGAASSGGPGGVGPGGVGSGGVGSGGADSESGEPGGGALGGLAEGLGGLVGGLRDGLGGLGGGGSAGGGKNGND